MGKSGPAWRYPDRSRCLRCHNYFGFVVIEDLYCSSRCAGLPSLKFPDFIRSAPILDTTDPRTWPRECRNGKRRNFKPKTRYRTREDAELVVYRRDPWEEVGTLGNGPARLFYRPERWPEEFTSPMQVYECGHCWYFHIGHNFRDQGRRLVGNTWRNT